MKYIYALLFIFTSTLLNTQDHYQQKFGDHFQNKGFKSNLLFHNYRYFFVENHIESTNNSNQAHISITEMNMDGEIVNFKNNNVDSTNSYPISIFKTFSNAVIMGQNIYVASSILKTTNNDCFIRLHIFDFNGNLIQNKIISTEVQNIRNELMLSKYGNDGLAITYYGHYSNYIKRHFIDITNQHQNFYTDSLIVSDTLISQSPQNYFKYQNQNLSLQELSISNVDNDGIRTAYLLNGKNGAILARLDQPYSLDDLFYFQGYTPGNIKIKNYHLYFTLNGDQDIRFVKMDFYGNTIWDKSIPHVNDRHISHVVAHHSSNQWAINRSYFDSFNNIESQWLVYDDQGNLVSQHFDDVIQLDYQEYDTYMYSNGYSTTNISQICDEDSISNNNQSNQNIGSYVIKREKNLNGINDLTTSNKIFKHYNFLFRQKRSNLTINNFRTALKSDSITHKNLNYNKSLVISGKDTINQDFHGYPPSDNGKCVGPYGSQNRTEYERNNKWNNSWIVTKQQVDDHIAAHQQGDFSYRMPMSIKYWPGNGDSNFGEPDQVLPFKDLNNDGIYQPKQGEYPIIKGDWTAAKVYSLTKDGYDCTHEQDFVVDVYEINYGFICDQDSALKHSYFKEYTVINRSNIALDSLYIGEYNDGDVGCYVNDFVGTDVNRGMTYIYNASLVDASCQGSHGFGENSPAIGFGILKGPKKEPNGMDDQIGSNSYGSASGFGFDDGNTDNEYLGLETSFYFMNPGFGSPLPILTDPDTPEKLFKQMSITYNVAPHVEANGVPAKHMYFYDSDPMHYSTGGIDPGQPYWNEVTEGNQEGDRRIMNCSGPTKFYPGDTIHFVTHETTAIPYANDSIFIGVRLLEEYVDDLRQYYKDNQTPCGQNFNDYEPFDGTYDNLSLEKEENNSKVYPNPFNDQLIIESDYPLEEIVLYDMSGRVLRKIQGEHANYKQVNWGELSKGNYLIQLKGASQADFIKVVKM